MHLDFITADVFTDRRFGGNPLAVMLDADGLDDALMQTIARELNLSETVFVQRAQEAGHAAKLRIFTPAMELPFAGHPTVGTALILAWEGRVDLRGPATEIVLEEGVGPVPVTISAKGREARRATLTAAQLPEEGPAPASDVLARLLGLSEEEIVSDPGGDRPRGFSCGVPFLIIPLVSRSALGRVSLDLGLWRDAIKYSWAPHLYCFTRDIEAFDAQVRMFAPAMGIAEDPATGAAASAFAGYLADGRAGEEGTMRWRIAQGVEMGRPSELSIEADRQAGRLTAVRVGGGAITVSRGRLALD